MADTKLYTLPDLTPAPYSEVQGLVRRLIEYADWSVLPALVDELREQRRDHELYWLRHLMGQRIRPMQFEQDDWGRWGDDLTGLFLFDLFDVAAVGSYFGAIGWVDRETTLRRFLSAQTALREGQLVSLPRSNVTVGPGQNLPLWYDDSFPEPKADNV